MIVEGAILDAEGPRPAYVRIVGGRVREVGKLGTDSRRGRERRVRGIVLPRPVNSHTHLGDAAFSREPPAASVAELVRPPGGLKFRVLSATPRAAKIRAMRAALRGMEAEGIAVAVDFREEGLPGLEMLRAAASDRSVRVLALGRPLSRPLDRVELDRLLRVADGIGLSAAREEAWEDRATLARECRRRGKRYALHASEDRREAVDSYLRPKPDLLIHLTRAAPADLEAVRREGVRVAICARSNALFGRVPPLAALERIGVATLVGTDNAMLQAPSIFRELEFAYVSSRLVGRPVSAAFLARAAFVEPWLWLGEPGRTRITPDLPGSPLVLRLPPADPAYQVVTRATEQLIVPTGAP